MTIEEEDIQNTIIEALNFGESVDDGESTIEIDNVISFEEAGVMTYNKGLVIRLTNGREYQVAIVRSV